MTDFPNEASAGPTVGEIAREEFGIVAKAFFAPVYGSWLVLRQLLKVTQRVDSNAPVAVEAEACAVPAE